MGITARSCSTAVQLSGASTVTGVDSLASRGRCARSQFTLHYPPAGESSWARPSGPGRMIWGNARTGLPVAPRPVTGLGAAHSSGERPTSQWRAGTIADPTEPRTRAEEKRWSWCPGAQVGARELCCFSSGELFTPRCRRQAVVAVSAKLLPRCAPPQLWPATAPWGLTPTALHEGGNPPKGKKIWRRENA